MRLVQVGEMWLAPDAVEAVEAIREYTPADGWGPRNTGPVIGSYVRTRSGADVQIDGVAPDEVARLLGGT